MRAVLRIGIATAVVPTLIQALKAQVAQQRMGLQRVHDEGVYARLDKLAQDFLDVIGPRLTGPGGPTATTLQATSSH